MESDESPSDAAEDGPLTSPTRGKKGQEQVKEEANVFTRSNLLKHTPPQVSEAFPVVVKPAAAKNVFANMMRMGRQRASSCLDLTMGQGETSEQAEPADVYSSGPPPLSPGGEKPIGDKRKQSPELERSDENKRARITVESPFARAMKKFLFLDALVKQHVTTPRRIKETVMDLKKLLGAAQQEHETMCADLLELKRTKGQNPGTNLPNIREKLSIDMGINEISTLIKEDWPSESLTKTTLNVRDLAGEKAAVKSTLIYPDNFKGDPNFERLAVIVPEVKSLTTEHFKRNGTVEIIKRETTKITGMDGAELSKVYIIEPALLSEVGALDVADAMRWCNAIKSATKTLNTKIAEAFVPEDVDVSLVRKIMECSLHGSDIKVLIRLSKAQRKMFQIKRKTEDTRNQDAIIIKAKPGSTYSDVVKELKKSMSPDEIGVTVKRINSTLTGNVRIQLAETKEGGRQKMVERIRAQVKTAEETKIQRRTKGIVIMEMEDDIDSDFVKGCLSSALNIDSEDIRTNPIRKMQRGTQMVTVFLPHEAATAAITMGKIKIGWTMCPVKERSDPPFCSKCQVYGHHTGSCKATTQANRKCLRCGSEEHITRDCKSADEYCISCKTKGHRANSMVCPVYKGLVNGQRR